jgi:23S rRNA pseudouridine2605 synthase
MSSREDGAMRLGKLLAIRGVASRRKAEELIFEGHVAVNGELVKHPATMVNPDVDVVNIDGEPLPDAVDHAYYLLFKPKGCVTSRQDPHKRKTVHSYFQHLPEKVEAVGRLDYDTEGALVLTNDGDLAYSLTHPSKKVPKRFMAKVYRTPSEKTIEMIANGKVYLEDGPLFDVKVRTVDATDTGNCWVEITITGGRNRVVRRLFQQIGHPVSKLRRESFATLSIRGMERGEVRPLTADEVRRLKDIGAGEKPKKAGRVRRRAGFAVPKKKAKRLGRKKRTRRA